MRALKEIVNNLLHCKKLLEFLRNDIIEYSQVVQWFQEFCAALTSVIENISKYIKEVVLITNQSQWEPFLLYLTQLTAVLTFLIDTLVAEVDMQKTITEARNFVFKQVHWCLEKLEECISVNNDGLELDRSVGSFLKLVDLALDNINELNLDNFEEESENILTPIRTSIEEVLTHAMSVAQVATDDCKSIKGSCQMVLEGLDSLTNELTKQPRNPAMFNLFVDVCNDKLCALERRVNTAVLKLTLKVFSRFIRPLQQLRQLCCSEAAIAESEIDSAVADFDLHVDRLMQVGFFAASCANDVSKAVQMKSCLISLEALEIELVPAFRSVMTDNSEEIVAYAKLLEFYWMRQAKLLQEYIYGIIDPVAFVQVIYDDLKNDTEQLKSNSFIKKEDISLLTDKAHVLVIFMQMTINDFEMSNLKGKIHRVKIAIHEMDSAAKVLLKNSEEFNEKNISRVLKRCKLLLNMIKQLKHCIQDENMNTSTTTASEPELEVDDKVEPPENVLFQNNFFDHIMQRGKQLLKERSLLNHTPQKSKTQSMLRSGKNREISLYKLVHLRRMQFKNMQVREVKSIDQQMSDMLNDIANLSNSLV